MPQHDTKLKSGTICPYCEYKVDTAGGLDASAPKPGAIMLCLRCGGIGVFGDDMGIRKPTIAELREVQDSDEWDRITSMQAFVRHRRTVGNWIK